MNQYSAKINELKQKAKGDVEKDQKEARMILKGVVALENQRNSIHIRKTLLEDNIHKL